jgi:hypothetical protein
MNQEILTVTCEYCGTIHSYVRTRRFKKYCSHNCAVKYNGHFVRDKKNQSDYIIDYYTKFPCKRFLVSTKASAKKRNLAFDLSEEWFRQKLEKGICEITGLPIKPKMYVAGEVGKRSYYSPSIDRIDNAVGYLESNCRIVCWGLNMAKSKYTDRDLNALSLALVLSHLPTKIQQEVLEYMPKNLLASLPSGNPYYPI